MKNTWTKSGLLGAGEAGEPEGPARTGLDSLADKEDDEVIMEPANSDPDTKLFIGM